jgi:transposase
MALKKFKDYAKGQTFLLPPSLDELIDAHHPVRIVDQVLDQIDITILERKYHGGGASSYHPRMLLKVLVYGYLSNIYSSRRLEAAIKENIHFMWLSGMAKPDHNTINRFRGQRLEGILKKIFSQVVLLLADQGIISLKETYVDGTKIEADANKYSFVWGKMIHTNKDRIRKQLDQLWAYAQEVAAEELNDTEPLHFEAIDPEMVRQTVEQIDQALKHKHVDPVIKRKVSNAKKNYEQKLKHYDEQQKILGERNSFSKTDNDATFMRLKEDHMKNTQLKPAYNLQLSTNDQFILNYSLHQNPADTTTLEAHLEAFHQLYDCYPEVLTADAGYGSEENYALLEAKAIEAYVKYNYFHLDQSPKYRDDPYRQDNLHYNAKQDYFVCPSGGMMLPIKHTIRKTSNGYEQTIVRYQARDCQGCPLREQCNKSEGNRTIDVNHRLRAYKIKVKERLLSNLGIEHRKKRCCDVEAVFGLLKHNKNLRRFHLRGLDKVETETGLLAIAHNLAKMIN